MTFQLFNSLLMYLILATMGIYLARQLLVAHRTPGPIDMRDVILDPKTGRISPPYLFATVLMVVSSWVIVYETVAGRLTGEIFICYVGQVLTMVVKVWRDNEPPPAPMPLASPVTVEHADKVVQHSRAAAPVEGEAKP